MNLFVIRFKDYLTVEVGKIAEHQFNDLITVFQKVKEDMKITILENDNDEDNVIVATIYDYSNMINANFDFIDDNKLLEIYKAYLKCYDFTWSDIIYHINNRDGIFINPALLPILEEGFIEGYQDVLIPDAERFAPFIADLVQKYDNAHIVLTTQDNSYCKLFELMFYGNEFIEVKNLDVFKQDFISEKFHLILSVPPMGVRLLGEESKDFICRELDLITAENLALHLSSGGILSIVLPVRTTYATGKIQDFREFIQSMYCIKEISSLPVGTLEHTSVNAILLTLTTGRTDEVTIKKYEYTNNKRNELEVAAETFILSDELTEMGNWNINLVFASQDEEWNKYNELNIKKQELGDLVEISRGKSVSKKDENGNVGVVNISNIGDYEVDYDSLDHLEIEEKKINNYLLQTGDLLIPARGTSIRIAVFEEQSYPCIASSNVIVIRPKSEKISSVYLKMFFDTPLGRKILISQQQGATIINISYKELNSVEVPLPSIEEQNAIAEEYLTEYKTYKETIEKANDRWNSVLSKLQERI